MPNIKIQTNFNIDLDFETAEFHRRLIAWGIDLFIQVFYVIIVSKLFLALRNGKSFDIDDAYDSWAIGLLLILPFFLYHVISELTMNGQSIGKRLMRIRVVNENGGKASIGQYLIRWLIRTSAAPISARKTRRWRIPTTRRGRWRQTHDPAAGIRLSCSRRAGTDLPEDAAAQRARAWWRGGAPGAGPAPA